MPKNTKILVKWQNMAKANFFLGFEDIMVVFVRFLGKIVALPQERNNENVKNES